MRGGETEASGIFFDPDKMHVLNHEGEHLFCAGSAEHRSANPGAGRSSSRPARPMWDGSSPLKPPKSYSGASRTIEEARGVLSGCLKAPV